MAIITLISDWGYRDHFIASVKGKLIGLMPDATIIDISHNIETFNIWHAAYVLRSAYPSFPPGTINIIGVESIAGPATPHTLVKYHDRWFIGADNGIFSLLFPETPKEIWEIEVHSDTSYFTFPSRDVFPKVAAGIVSGVPLTQMGNAKKEVKQMLQFEPVTIDNSIKGKIIHIDNYHNAVTNISEQLFKSFVHNSRFEITIKGNLSPITTISLSYGDVPEGEKVALFNSSGYLQISMNKGAGSTLFGFNVDDSVLVERL